MMHRLESEWKACRVMNGELEKTAKTVNSLISNFRVCSNTPEDFVITQYKKQTEHVKEELAEPQETATSDYWIVEQKFQFTEWQKWSCKEQIQNLVAMDEATALSGNCSIPKYCILTLRKEQSSVCMDIHGKVSVVFGKHKGHSSMLMMDS
jgi:hypothetical protein